MIFFVSKYYFYVNLNIFSIIKDAFSAKMMFSLGKNKMPADICPRTKYAAHSF